MTDHETQAAADYRFDDTPAKDPGESMDVVLDLTPWCIIPWTPGTDFATSSYCRSPSAPGVAFQATTGGTSGAREPRWPTSGTVNDGSIVWTVNSPPGANGLNPISAVSATSEPTGLTIGSISVVANRQIAATYSGGTHGYDYAAVFQFTLRGITRIARQLVPVKRR